MLDQVLMAFIVALIIQGLKQLGFPVSGNVAKFIAIAVAALFFLGNELINAFVPPAWVPFLQAIIDAIKFLLLMAAPSGVYGFVKLFTR